MAAILKQKYRLGMQGNDRWFQCSELFPGQLQCWETLDGRAQRGLETDSAEPSPSMMTRTHVARYQKLNFFGRTGLKAITKHQIAEGNLCENIKNVRKCES